MIVAHESHRHLDYGLTCAEYDGIADEQGMRCAICDEAAELVIDHDHRHDTRAVRGLVCAPCNTSLRQADRGHRKATPAQRRYLDNAWHLRHRPGLPPLYQIPGSPNHDAYPVSTGEIALMLGVSRQRVHQLVIQPGFPEPWARLMKADVWRNTDIEAWAKTRNTRRGRPRKMS